MQTMQPSIILGSYGWAQDRLPIDEFQVRLDDAREHMSRQGWRGLLIYGDAREHAALAYLTNFIPRMRWGMALMAAGDGDPRLLCSMSARDIPAMRSMTWIADVRSGWEWDKAFDPWFGQFDGETAVLGTIGFDRMAFALSQSVRLSLGGRFQLERADDVLKIPRRTKRPRESSIMRRSCQVLETAASAFVESWRFNRAPEIAALDGERAARRMAAQDVRTLVSHDGGRTLVPFQGRFDTSRQPLAGYIAVKVQGYWADMFVGAGIQAQHVAHRAEAALDALVTAIRPGVMVADARQRAIEALGPFKLHPVLCGSVGHGIGLSLHEGPEFDDGCRIILDEDGIYALQVGLADPPSAYALKSAIVRNTARGAEVLARSPSPVI
jgi:Xaa-Pro aminopeptidase